MDDLQRINIKFFLTDSGTLETEEAFRIFNGWITQSADELLIDVADYSHVPSGPVILLVGHAANYGIDDGDGRRGFLYARKQPLPGSLTDRLRAILTASLRACRRLEETPELDGRVRFRGDELLLTANDRLRAPNTDETLAALDPQLSPVLETLFTGASFSYERNSDPGERFNLRVKTQASPDISQLLANLEN